jgi:hypothetical protein
MRRSRPWINGRQGERTDNVLLALTTKHSQLLYPVVVLLRRQDRNRGRPAKKNQTPERDATPWGHLVFSGLPNCSDHGNPKKRE